MPSNNDTLIEQAREILTERGYYDIVGDDFPATEMANFARSVLPEWRVIEVDGLPEEGGYYLWQFRSNGEAKVQHFYPSGNNTTWFAQTYIAWQELPAKYQPQGEGKDVK